MSNVTCGVTMSLDGFVAGDDMTLENPFGHISPDVLMRWMFDDAERHDDEKESLTAAGAFIMGSNMFGPKDNRMTDAWSGWWGDNPPYHAPVFVLSHTPRDPITMAGDTTFTFVTDGIESAFELAQSAAGTKDIAIAGGANVINQYLRAGLIDELWLHIAPVTIGHGQKLFLDTPGIVLKPLEVRTTELVTHIKYAVTRS
jgi:dihydrofolate reductase